MSEIKPEIKEIKRGGRRPGAGRPKKDTPKHDHATCHRELGMLRLDVERLKGELAASRAVPSERRTPPFGGGNLPALKTGTLWNTLPAMPADATCGGPGRCGRIGCGHPGW